MHDTVQSQIIVALDIDAIRGMLDTFTLSSVEHHAIFAGRMIPEKYQDLNQTILVYSTSPIGSGDIRPINFTASCRAETEYRVQSLAELVYDALNRTFGTGTYYQAVIQPPIRETDNCWHIPVEINCRNSITT